MSLNILINNERNMTYPNNENKSQSANKQQGYM